MTATETLNVSALPIHQAAQVWPMLTDSELDALAQSIADNGLLHPVVVWRDDEGIWWLLDGRNRLAACERLGITPEYETYEGADPAVYVLLANDFRRHSSPSQRAMAVALTVTTTRGRPQKDANLRLYDEQVAVKAGVSERLISSCRYVRDHAPELVDAVLAGTIRSSAAEAEAKRRVAEKEDKARKAIADRDTLTRLAPDLAEKLVFDEDGADSEDIAGEYQARVDQSCIAVSQWNQAIGQIRDACRALSKIDGGEVPEILEMAASQNKTIDAAALGETLNVMPITAKKLEEINA